MARPFLKWAGGKTQLINQIAKTLPKELSSTDFVYVEPFIGSGAVLFWFLEHFPTMKKAVINDLNADLINTYNTIKNKPHELIAVLKGFEEAFRTLESKPDKRKNYYYNQRTLYNTRSGNNVLQAALFIFLNRTCFNGLYRVNKNNEFNVPMGSYRNPTICDSENILSVSKALQNVEILCGDYEQTLKHAGKRAFFYFDPPYKPISITSSFNSYANSGFDDEEQARLARFCAKLDKQNHKWMLSNSDVKTTESDNLFFDVLYSNFTIRRVKARRNINSKADKRGQLNELLITNYD
ncbi:MAG: DNA adenine methylase [Bacteroidia bacterium]|jgi:DNA adenine methylase